MEYYITYLLVMFLTSCWICGFEYTFNEGEIFDIPGIWMRANWPVWINKPLFDCPYCMSSIHGTIFFFIFLYPLYPLSMWIVFCFALCGLIAILKK